MSSANNPPGSPPAPPTNTAAVATQTAFLVVAVGYVLLAPNRAQLQTVSIMFVSIVLEAIPFMLLGALVGGFIEVFVPRKWVARALPKRRWLMVLAAGLLGILFPVCECAVIPVVRRLLRKGVPLGAAVAYLLAAPIVNPVVTLSTATAYSFAWPVVLGRMAFGYAIAVTIGLAMEQIFRRGEGALVPGIEAPEEDCCTHGATPATLRTKIGAALGHAADEFLDIGRYLVMGAFLAGLLQTIVPRQGFTLLADTPFLAILAMMGLAVVLNLCSESDAFVAASFRGAGLPLSAQMAFMVLGPMFDIKLLAMYHGVFRRKAILVLTGLILSLVFMAMMLFEVLL